MQVLYVRAPGPGAIIRLVERFALSGTWSVLVTPADVKSGYRCVVTFELELLSLANHLATSLGDDVYILEEISDRLRIVRITPNCDIVDINAQPLVDVRLGSFALTRQHRIRKALTGAGLPLWKLKLHRLRHVPYETVRVLDQRDLLVEAPDVMYTAQGTTPE